MEEHIKADGVVFEVLDVGGQRSERKKWVHCFERVTAVIFVGALAEYDQTVWEDNVTDRSKESVNSSWFQKTAMILFLNKVDLFREKLFRVPYRLEGVRNEDFEGPYAEDPEADKEECIQAAADHVLQKYLNSREAYLDKAVFHHLTCATDRL